MDLEGQFEPRPRGSICTSGLEGQFDPQVKVFRENLESRAGAALDSTNPEIPKTEVDPLKDPTRPEVDRLTDWVAVHLAEQDHDPGSIAETIKEARKWCQGELPALWFAQAVQSAIDRLALRPSHYIQPILAEIREAIDAGRPVKAKAECSFVPDNRLKISAPLPAYVGAKIDPADRAYWSRARVRSTRATSPMAEADRRRKALEWLKAAPTRAEEVAS